MDKLAQEKYRQEKLKIEEKHESVGSIGADTFKVISIFTSIAFLIILFFISLFGIFYSGLYGNDGYIISVTFILTLLVNLYFIRKMYDYEEVNWIHILIITVSPILMAFVMITLAMRGIE